MDACAKLENMGGQGCGKGEVIGAIISQKKPQTAITLENALLKTTWTDLFTLEDKTQRYYPFIGKDSEITDGESQVWTSSTNTDYTTSIDAPTQAIRIVNPSDRQKQNAASLQYGADNYAFLILRSGSIVGVTDDRNDPTVIEPVLYRITSNIFEAKAGEPERLELMFERLDEPSFRNFVYTIKAINTVNSDDPFNAVRDFVALTDIHIKNIVVAAPANSFTFRLETYDNLTISQAELADFTFVDSTGAALAITTTTYDATTELYTATPTTPPIAAETYTISMLAPASLSFSGYEFIQSSSADFIVA